MEWNSTDDALDESASSKQKICFTETQERVRKRLKESCKVIMRFRRTIEKDFGIEDVTPDDEGDTIDIPNADDDEDDETHLGADAPNPIEEDVDTRDDGVSDQRGVGLDDENDGDQNASLVEDGATTHMDTDANTEYEDESTGDPEEETMTLNNLHEIDEKVSDDATITHVGENFPDAFRAMRTHSIAARIRFYREKLAEFDFGDISELLLSPEEGDDVSGHDHQGR